MTRGSELCQRRTLCPASAGGAADRGGRVWRSTGRFGDMTVPRRRPCPERRTPQWAEPPHAWCWRTFVRARTVKQAFLLLAAVVALPAPYFAGHQAETGSALDCPFPH